MTIQVICDNFNISQSYLCRLFRKYTNSTINRFITNARIEHAKTLLEERPGILIKDIAVDCGYSDPLYFSKTFKTITGMTPSEYADNRTTAHDR